MNALQYWNRGVDHVPVMTGAATLLDASDVPEIAAALGIGLPLRQVLDVGCGTGRLAQHCTGYLGVDIAPDAVEYCRRAGLVARTITGPDDLPGAVFGWVACLSVFTHVGRSARAAYLARFARLAPELLVDILPGDGRGTMAAWTAEPRKFEAQLRRAGYSVAATYDRTSPHGFGHRYYWARREGTGAAL